MKFLKEKQDPPVHEHHLAKGTLYLMIANVIFLSSGYIIHFGLGRCLGPKEYGTFGVILSLLAITQIFLQSGVSQAVSKYIAEGKDIAQVKNEGMKFQILFSFVIFIIYFSSAPLLADLLNDTSLTNYIRLSAFVLPIRAVTEIYKGTLVGVRAFDKRAKTTAFYAVTKVLVVFVLVAIGLAITGVIMGYIIATFAALILAKHWCTFNKSRLSDKIGDTFVKGTIIKFAFPIILFAFAYTAATKNMTTGEGGMITTDSEEITEVCTPAPFSSTIFHRLPAPIATLTQPQQSLLVPTRERSGE